MNKQSFIGKKIGIWGFGVVGKSLVRYLGDVARLTVLEKRLLTEEETLLLAHANVRLYENNQHLENFLHDNDYIIASPGIDVRPYQQYRHKFIAELDLFASHWQKPIIAVTGSVGKTTTVHILHAILQAKGVRVAFGGNVGIGMIDLIAQQNSVDCALLELSSFQLESVKQFRPNIALWTNLFANHLDRHGTMQAYFDAKYMLLQHQQEGDTIVLPFALLKEVYAKRPKSRLIVVAKERPTEQELLLLSRESVLFFIADGYIQKMCNGIVEQCLSVESLPALSFMENWLAVYALLDAYNKPLHHNDIAVLSLYIPEHRLQKCATRDSIDFYDDSKSTIAQATMAAVQQLQGRPIILLLGGLSKGVDRSTLIMELRGLVKYVICFGQEAAQLKKFCDIAGLSAAALATLEEAVHHAVQLAKPDDQVLLSPAGTSFDLFANYKERGNRFQELVAAKIKRI